MPGPLCWVSGNSPRLCLLWVSLYFPRNAVPRRWERAGSFLGTVLKHVCKQLGTHTRQGPTSGRRLLSPSGCRCQFCLDRLRANVLLAMPPPLFSPYLYPRTFLYLSSAVCFTSTCLRAHHACSARGVRKPKHPKKGSKVWFPGILSRSSFWRTTRRTWPCPGGSRRGGWPTPRLTP